MPDLKPPTFSFGVFTLLVSIFAASWTMFWLLVRRATTDRQWVSLSRWGRNKGLRLRRFDESSAAPAPAPLDEAPLPPRPILELFGGRISLVQFEPSAVALDRPSDPAAMRFGTRWNVLIRRLENTWPATALRPVNESEGPIDLFSLGGFPTMLPPDRFMVFGVDSVAARAVAKSGLTGLLPPDIGLLLHGPHLVLDFSKRPFDDIELDRMLVLAEQLTTFLPQPPSANSL